MTITHSEMPAFQCHKRVTAARITNITKDHVAEGLPVRVSLDGCGEMLVPLSFCRRFNSEVGGYFVEYEDGYQSYSPPEAFESGYAPISKFQGES